MRFQGIDVDKLFPYQLNEKASYRNKQDDAVIKALTALVEQDYEVFFLDCPVGFGKSAVLITVARVLRELGCDSYYTTPLLILQDQLKEFEDLPQIKGRSNYVCADDPEVTCADAECQVDEKYECPNKGVCSYVVQRNKCQESALCGMNSSYLMTVRKEVFDERYLLMVDEAHGVPEWGIGFVSVIIKESDVGMIPVFDKGFQAYLIWLEKMVYPKVKARYDELKEMVKSFGKTKRKAMLSLFEDFKRVRDLVKKIELLSADYAENEEEWIFDIVDNVRGKKIVFKPITSGRFLNNILWNRGKKIVLSSGTITPEIYMKEGGLNGMAFDEKDCVMTVPSDFPPEKSPIYYKAIGKMTHDRKEYTFPLIMKEINKVISERRAVKGILHTFSYDNADYILKNINPELRGMLQIQDRTDRSGSLEKWVRTSEPSVFVSTNMTEGLDLKGDLCRYQVYVKVGFPSTQDKRVAKRIELGNWLWYFMQAMEDIEQSAGRATRSKDDWSEMFIFDASFASLYIKYGKYMKPWFKERLNFINV